MAKVEDIYNPHQLAVIKRGVGLRRLTLDPYWPEIVRISKALFEEAQADLSAYPKDGAPYDLNTLAALHSRARTAQEHHDRLFNSIQAIILAGENEVANPNSQEVSPQSLLGVQ